VRFSGTLAAIDAANSADPRLAPNGKPWEVDHAERVSDWILRLNPHASELLQIAARGQHIERWTSPRSSYPEGRAGYLRWREDLKITHARRTGDIMAAAGYAPNDVLRVAKLISKAALREGDPEGCLLEDALCLVFLETQFKDLLSKTPEDKMEGILKKTWQKMSPAGRAAAHTLAFSPEEQKALSKALSPSPTQTS
jgi:hypothetical protein